MSKIPAEKQAHELVESFMIQLISHLPRSTAHDNMLAAAKNSAIICAKLMKSVDDRFYEEYWDSVIEEIRKL